MLLMHTEIAIHMMIEKKYPLTQEMLSRMLSRRLEVDQESEMAFELLSDFDWDDVQAQIQADEDLAQRMLEEERESLSIVERARLLAELIDKRKKLQAA
ncbi:hypothetical protein Tco_1011470 [Tanacetum coccineum]